MNKLKILEKHWPLLSIVFLIVLLASQCLWPELLGPLSIAVIVLSVGSLITLTVYRRLEEKRIGHIERAAMVYFITLDILGILLVLISAMVVGSFASKMVGTAVFNAFNASALQHAEEVSSISSLLAALTAGAVIGWLMRSVWERVEGVLIRSDV
jgi:hypothetical protein